MPRSRRECLGALALALFPGLPGRAPLAVLERDFARWGVVAFVGAGVEPHLVRKGVGHADAVRRPRYQLEAREAGYFSKANASAEDFLKQRLLNRSAHREPTFAAAAALLPPSRDYVTIGEPRAHSKFGVSAQGRITCANYSIFVASERGASTAGSENGRLLFDPRDYLAWWPASNFSETKSALLGRYSRGVSVAAWDPASERGFVLTAVPNTARGHSTAPYDQAELVLRLQEASVADSKGSQQVPAARSPARFFGVASGPFAECVVCYDNDTRVPAGLPGDRPCPSLHNCTVALPRGAAVREIRDGGAEFWAQLLLHTEAWQDFHASGGSGPAGGAGEGALGVALRYNGTEGQRLVDMARAVIGASMSVWVADRPFYGSGSNYWRPGDRGSLPFTSYALDYALLLWGHADEAARRVAYYFQHYVRAADGLTPSEIPGIGPGARVDGAPGSLDLKRWRFVRRGGEHEPPACTFDDSLADYGRWLDLWAETARGAGDDWALPNWEQAQRMANYTLWLHDNATRAAYAPPARGLIIGPAEHDTCLSEAPFFSINVWTWRGWITLARYLDDRDAARWPHARDYARQLRAHAASLRASLDAATEASLVRTAAGAPYFLPPYAASNFTPYGSMVESTKPAFAGGSSYANFRYFSEMLSAQYFGDELDTAISDFRESHRGTISGVSRSPRASRHLAEGGTVSVTRLILTRHIDLDLGD